MMPFIEDQKPTAFNIDYFINKFEAIPEDQWCEGDFVNRSGQHCALGHCGAGLTSDADIEWSKESIALREIAPDIMGVNDGNKFVIDSVDIKGKTPKERVIRYLKAIKEGRV